MSDWRDSSKPCQAHVYGEWIETNDGSGRQMRRRVTCAAVQSKKVTTEQGSASFNPEKW